MEPDEGATYKNPAFDPDDPNNDDEDEEEVNRTDDEFQPGLSSTTYHEGEEHEGKKHKGEELEMQTFQHEQSGLPETSYTEETPLLGKSAQSMKEKAWNALNALFPKSSATNLEASYTPKGKLQVKMAGVGKKLYTLFTKERSTGKERLNPNISLEIKKELGPTAEELIAQHNATIREETLRFKEAEKQLQQAERINAQKEKAAQEAEDLRIRIDRTQARIDQLGSNVENESELRYLQQRVKNYKTDLENAKKEVVALEKQAKKIDSEKEKAEKLRVTISAEERKKNEMQERLNTTKTFDELKERRAEIQRENEEDQAIIDNVNASPSDIAAAQERFAEREEEDARLATQIEERVRDMPLRERVKEIFKKYGVTVASIFLAAGATIAAIVSAILSSNGFKAVGNGLKKLGNGLKEIGKKLASPFRD